MEHMGKPATLQDHIVVGVADGVSSWARLGTVAPRQSMVTIEDLRLNISDRLQLRLHPCLGVVHFGVGTGAENISASQKINQTHKNAGFGRRS